MPTYIDPINGKGKKNTLKYAKTTDQVNKTHSTTFKNLDKVVHQNRIFSKNEIDIHNAFNRFGWVDVYNTGQICREYLFFTKPDLYIFDGSNYSGATLNASLAPIPFFRDAYERNKESLIQLQYYIKDKHGRRSPFMCIFSNNVTSKMDLPALSAESQDSTSNLYGTNISYRSHSMKADNAFDFTLSFRDTDKLEIYTIVKAYDEYMRLSKTGQIDCNNSDRYKNYIINKILNEQFSVYKFIVGSDGETILYFAKATGVYFTDVPRSDFGDPPTDGFKFSLSFHANFIEDMNPMILTEFNRVTNGKATSDNTAYADVYDYENHGVNNEWVMYPVIRPVINGGRINSAKDYMLKWTNVNKSGGGKYSGGGTYGSPTGVTYATNMDTYSDSSNNPSTTPSSSSGSPSTASSSSKPSSSSSSSSSSSPSTSNTNNDVNLVESLRIRIISGLESVFDANKR